MRIKSENDLDELIEAHWNYIKVLLQIHGETKEVVNKIGFHYKTAFKHGWKHGFEMIEK